MIIVHSVNGKARILNKYFYFSKMFSYYGILSASTYTELRTAIRVLISTMPYCELPSTKHNKVVNFLYCRQNNSYSNVWRRKKHQYLQLSYVKLDLDTKWENIIAYINPKNKTSSFSTLWSSGNLFWMFRLLWRHFFI